MTRAPRPLGATAPGRALRRAGARAARACVLPLALLAAIAASACAHDVSYSHAEVHWDRARVALELDVHRDDAAALLGGVRPESLMSAPVLSRHRDRLAALLAPRCALGVDGHALRLVLLNAEPLPARHAIALSFAAAAPAAGAALSVSAHLFPGDPLHETFLDVYSGGRLVRQEVLTREHAGTRVYGTGAAAAGAVFATFLAAGIHHIFIGPDHILFIVGLMLLGGGLARVLKVATAFTLAHSITLALAALSIARVPSRLVEPLIALSIVYVAVENLRAGHTKRDWRARLAFAFGLVHGFGFAGVLREFGLPREALAVSLLAFNVGVECGQAAIILGVTPLLALLRAGAPRVAPRAIAACSWAIAAVGGYWFVQRLLVRG